MALVKLPNPPKFPSVLAKSPKSTALPAVAGITDCIVATSLGVDQPANKPVCPLDQALALCFL